MVKFSKICSLGPPTIGFQRSPKLVLSIQVKEPHVTGKYDMANGSLLRSDVQNSTKARGAEAQKRAELYLSGQQMSPV